MKMRPGTTGLTGEQILHAAKIDSFIPEAEAKAKKRLKEHLAAGGRKTERRPGSGVCRGNISGDYYKHSFEDQFFHEEMNRLTREAGLRTI